MAPCGFGFIICVLSMLTSSLGFPKPSEVVVLGSVAVDFVAYTSSLPQLGETVLGSSFSKNFGGKGANQAVQCARLGIDVSMCGCIGQDSLGEDYLKQLEIEKVATPFMTRTAEKSTGVAVINVETTSGANTIVIVPGANENVLLSVDDAAHKQMVEHIKQAHVIICQNEIPLASTLSAMQIAKSGGTLSIFNPAPASRNLLDVAVVSDIVCPNESELSTLTSLKTNTEEEIAIAADCLLGLGCKVVVVTLGERGAYLATKTKKMFIRAEAVAAVDSTGAGDSFIGTLASNIARGSSLQVAVKNALYCATHSVQHPGAQKSYACSQDIPKEFRPPALSEFVFDKKWVLDSASDDELVSKSI